MSNTQKGKFNESSKDDNDKLLDETTSVNNESLKLSLELKDASQVKDKFSSTDCSSSLSSMLSIDCNIDSKLDYLIQKAINTPLTGTVTQHGDVVEFVSDNLDNMIKMSSPIGRSECNSSTTSSPSHVNRRHPGHRSFGPSASSALNALPRSGSTSLSTASNKHLVDCMTRSTTSTSGWSNEEDLQSSASGWSTFSHDRTGNRPVDPRALYDLEKRTARIAEDVTDMTSTLQNHIQKITSVTYTCLDVYKDSVNNTCTSVDNSIKSMYALMAKCEQLCKNKAPIVHLHHQIQEINRLLDIFELQMCKTD